MILKKIGRTRTAAQRFTDCLELGTVYDPEIRRKCLEQLKEILEVILIMIFPPKLTNYNLVKRVIGSSSKYTKIIRKYSE